MAAVAPIISLGFTAVGAAMRFSAARKQDDAAHEVRQLAEMNAAVEEAEAREEERRMVFQAEKQRDRATALAAASGVTGEGSPGLMLEEMDTVLAEEVDWLRHSSKMRQAQIRAKGRNDEQAGLYKADQTRSAAWQRIFQGANQFGQSYNWWMA